MSNVKKSTHAQHIAGGFDKFQRELDLFMSSAAKHGAIRDVKYSSQLCEEGEMIYSALVIYEEEVIEE